MVEIQAPSSSRARSGRPRSLSAARMREQGLDPVPVEGGDSVFKPDSELADDSVWLR